MWFEQVREWITWFFNLTLPVVGLTVGAFCILVLTIFSKTSFGKKKYNEMKEKAEKIEKDFNTFITNSKDLIEDYKKQCDAKVEAIQTYYETMLAQKQAKEDELENLLLVIGENIHNENIKNVIKEYKEKMDGYRTIMTDKINKVKADYEQRLHALEVKLYGEEDSETKEE